MESDKDRQEREQAERAARLAAYEGAPERPPTTTVRMPDAKLPLNRFQRRRAAALRRAKK